MPADPGTPDLSSSPELIRRIRELALEEPDLLRGSDAQSCAWLGVAGLVIVASAWIAGRSPILGGGLAFFAIAVMQYYLLVAVHEAIHFGLFRHRGLNEFLGATLAAAGLSEFQIVRDHHLRHHSAYGMDGDPDGPEYKLPSEAETVASALAYMLKRGFAFSDLRTKLKRSVDPTESRKGSLASFAFHLALTQGALFLLFFLTGAWWSYFVFWLGPLLTISRFFNSFRMFGEHGGLTVVDLPPSHQILSARTTFDSRPWYRAPWWRIERLLFAPFHFNFHHEHHLLPRAPYSSLPALHGILVDAGHYQRHPEVLSRSFFRTLNSITPPSNSAVPPS